MRKIFSVLLVLALFVGVFSLNVMAQNSDMRVALVLSGFLGDQSFNDSSYEGLKRAQEEYGFELKVLESGVSSEWEQNLIAMASAGYDLVVANTTQFQQIVKNNAPMFPDTKFALIDGVVDLPNVVSAVFAQNEGSFLAGAAAAMFTQHDEIEGVNKDKIIGWVGGMDIPVLHDFLVGYKQGAKYIDPETKVLVSFAGTFNDPVKGKELTLSQYDQGADIVMNVASGTGNGILEAANETPHYAIGVDMNQDGIYPGAILTSMLKRMDQATYLIAKSVAEGNYEGGRTIKMDLSNGGVSLTDMSVMQEALGDKFPEEILTRIQELTEKVKNGEIEVDSYEGFQRN
ncbi:MULTISPECIES: BMP family protein [unclassified Halanaerobium]|uniref:BMP family lipoprotein n=1 Tax=unclassified Halanaerobium TaxID=2641197 RepID=UPI000DF317E6|nr:MULTISPECIES: BMP family ABC transporter substrate-binding protein [unclassified Halanaerobium]RCW43758.1 nucleoside-binding protein [Halanaerobium sp. MA284_MarDTE_T2]RCW89173.1 nucleoside-binding protein [Halanaerobium sp. DL-01]